jgi:ketosteroid isomerase-like protein
VDARADAEMIRELKHRYCWCFDDADLDGLMALFTEDAICELGPFGTWRGLAEIRAGYERQMRLSGVPGGRLHVVTNPIVEVDGDRATGRWYLTDHDISPGSTAPIRLIAGYADEYRRVDSQWRIARTVVQIRWRAP